MRITGHKTASMYRRYRIVDERDLKEATESFQAYLKTQPKTRRSCAHQKDSRGVKHGQ